MTRTTVSVELAGLGFADNMKNNSPVTYDEKKRWLKRYLEEKCALIDMSYEAFKASQRLIITTANYGGIVVSGSRNPHKFDEAAIAAYLPAVKRKRVDRIKRETLEAIYRIAALDQDPRNTQGQIKVLIWKYIEGKSWEEMQYSERQAKRHHKAGVANLHLTRARFEKDMSKKNQLKQ